jgi:hypothetical protein
VRQAFEDMHFVYAGLGAAAAAVVSVAILLGMMRFTMTASPDSLAALVRLLASPGSNQNPVPAGVLVQMPRPLDEAFPTPGDLAADDTLFTLSAVVTREGRVANLELLRANDAASVAPGTVEAQLVEDLMGAVSRTRFEPASKAGLPVAVNMVWIVAHTTVRAKVDAPPRTVVKKRAAAPDPPPLSPVRV